MRKPTALIAALCFTFGPAASAVELTPLFDMRVFSGQHFFEGDVSSLSGNAHVLYSPAMKFNEQWALIPTYSGGYQGTRDVQELAGGGTLFQDSSHHGLLLKGIYAPAPSLKLKATAGGRMEFLRETRDEKWGSGLFDYEKISGGLETEYALSAAAGGRLAYDYYTLKFPNYASLESTQDPTLARELTGTDVLDSASHLVTLGLWSPLPGRVRMDFSAYYVQRDFSDQPLVDAVGGLTGADRRDNVLAASSNLAYPLAMGADMRMVGELGLGYAMTDSNQNHFDARKTLFIKDYYDYSQMSATPRLTLALGGRPWLYNLAGGYTLRKYKERPVQDSRGDYLSDKTEITEITASFGVTYPVTKNFKLRTVGTLGWSDSNMKYEKVFRYNYKIANYMFGFSYEY